MSQQFPLPEGPAPIVEQDRRTAHALELLDAEIRYESDLTVSLSPKTELHRRVSKGVESTVIIAVPDGM